ncbi:uncharacterized protein LOC143452169 isoform X1 [Clavelina lepadiformis]|uniref:uncharacterized protein LOC143452169 isoform X1 n=2 Tax=Clavelina lepadiformis TaxID=159417 RepID=UPI0040413BD1
MEVSEEAVGENVEKKQQHIMISYNWDDSIDVARKICDRLTTAGYNVWIDKGQMKGNIYEKMAEGVENAIIVLIFVSPHYETSEHAQREASLAADLHKRIIPIRVQQDHKPSSWLRLITAGQFYHDFSFGSFDDNFKDLLDSIASTPGVENIRSDNFAALSTNKKDVEEEEDVVFETKTSQEEGRWATWSKNQGLLDTDGGEVAKKEELDFNEDNISDHLRTFADEIDRDNRTKLLDIYVHIWKSHELLGAAEYFPTRLDLSRVTLDIDQISALCYVLKNVEKQVEILDLFECGIQHQSFNIIALTLKKMRKTQIRKLNIGFNDLTSNSIDQIISLLPVIKDKLLLYACFSDDRGGRRCANQEEREKLQRALNKLTTSRPKVYVGLFTSLQAQR